MNCIDSNAVGVEGIGVFVDLFLMESITACKSINDKSLGSK